MVSSVKYSGVGFRLEAGFDYSLSESFIVAPKILNDISDVSADAAQKHRFNNFEASIGLAVQF